MVVTPVSRPKKSPASYRKHQRTVEDVIVLDIAPRLTKAATAYTFQVLVLDISVTGVIVGHVGRLLS